MKNIAKTCLIFVVFSGTVFSQNSQTNFWEQTGFDYGRSVTALAVNSVGYVFAGTFGRGIFRSINDGGDWSLNNFGITDFNVSTISISSSDVVFVGTEFTASNIAPPNYRSSDNGLNWTRLDTLGLITDDFAFAPDGDIFAATNSGLFRSADNGDNWTFVDTGLEFPNQMISAAEVNSLGIIFIGTREGVLRSSDNGVNWEMVNNGLEIFQPLVIYALAINSNNDLFISISSGAASRGIFRSRDNGDNWTTTGFRFDVINDIAINSLNDIYVATRNNGVFRSFDNGSSWFKINSGLIDSLNNTSTVTALSLAFNSSGELFLGSSQGAIFKSTESTTTTEARNNNNNLPKFFSLKQNYPNPFNPITHIPFSLKGHSNIRLTVYDILGREVTTLVNDFMSPGDYEITFDVTSYPNGLYFYRLEAGDFSETKRLMVIK